MEIDMKNSKSKKAADEWQKEFDSLRKECGHHSSKEIEKRIKEAERKYTEEITSLPE